MTEKKVTSIKISPEKWKSVKLYCIKNDIEISEFIEKLIDNALRKKEKNSDKNEKNMSNMQT